MVCCCHAVSNNCCICCELLLLVLTGGRLLFGSNFYGSIEQDAKIGSEGLIACPGLSPKGAGMYTGAHWYGVFRSCSSTTDCSGHSCIAYIMWLLLCCCCSPDRHAVSCSICSADCTAGGTCDTCATNPSTCPAGEGGGMHAQACSCTRIRPCLSVATC